MQNLESKQAEASKRIEKLSKLLANTTSKEEFYDFIRELNDELRKLEKNIATQGNLERHKAALNTQFRELSEEIKARRDINRQLKKLPTLDKRTQEIKRKLTKLESMNKKLKVLETNYLNWKNFLTKLERITQEERLSDFSKIREEFNSKLKSELSGIAELESKAITKQELRKQNKELRKLISEQAKSLKSQEKRISRLERGIGKPKKQKTDKSFVFPIVVLILIALLLTIGIVFYKEDIFSKKFYSSPKDLKCQQEYECTKLDNSTVLSDCIYDEKLQGCHCDAKALNLTKC